MGRAGVFILLCPRLMLTHSPPKSAQGHYSFSCHTSYTVLAWLLHLNALFTIDPEMNLGLEGLGRANLICRSPLGLPRSNPAINPIHHWHRLGFDLRGWKAPVLPPPFRSALISILWLLLSCGPVEEALVAAEKLFHYTNPIKQTILGFCRAL